MQIECTEWQHVVNKNETDMNFLQIYEDDRSLPNDGDLRS